MIFQRKIRFVAIVTAAVILGITAMEACKKPGAGVAAPTPVSFTIPSGFPALRYNLAENPPTEEGIELGRRLFYEGKLSRDGQFPCASCHQRQAAFGTFDHDRSHGYNHQHTLRNAPGLFNLAWQQEYQWDGGTEHLDRQAVIHIGAPNEMAESMENVLNKLRRDTTYPGLFRAAFGTDEINAARMLKALSQFMIRMVSAGSKYDRVKSGAASFYYYEQAGYETYQAKCATCHPEPLFTDLSYRNIGLPPDASLNDYGRMRVTARSGDSLKFRVPSLRNAALTFPYMHDGRLGSLEAVLDHYAENVQAGPTIDPAVARGIPLSAVEKVNLISFLKTLTDSAFFNNPRFAQP